MLRIKPDIHCEKTILSKVDPSSCSHLDSLDGARLPEYVKQRIIEIIKGKAKSRLHRILPKNPVRESLTNVQRHIR